jgi:hypothetical protein
LSAAPAGGLRICPPRHLPGRHPAWDPGYYLIEARDLNEAIQVASRIPGAKFGCVEVRPVAEDLQTLQALGVVAPESAR